MMEQIEKSRIVEYLEQRKNEVDEIVNIEILRMLKMIQQGSFDIHIWE